jgi:hypothetical protein
LKTEKKQDKSEPYLIAKRGDKYFICKVLNVYKSRKKAVNKMVDLLLAKTTEEELLNDYLKEE